VLDHVSIGVRDLARARRFYDAALGALGYRCLSADAASLGYGAEAANLWVLRVDRPVPEDAGSGLHLCFRARSRNDVDRFHADALATGGKDNGAPGLRPDYGAEYYAAFVVDPEGYRLEAYSAGE
jgi:catechol 2,3-dioxygenase-like lactoylglutathione lyase family enzyme